MASFHILTELIPITLVSVNRRNNEALGPCFADTNIYGTVSVKIWKTRHKISVDIGPEDISVWRIEIRKLVGVYGSNTSHLNRCDALVPDDEFSTASKWLMTRGSKPPGTSWHVSGRAGVECARDTDPQVTRAPVCDVTSGDVILHDISKRTCW